MRTEKVNFTNRESQKLSARISFPIDQHPHTYVLFAHCFTCNKNLSAIRNISSALTQRGFAILRFDFTGLGESEGDFADTNFSSNVADLIEAAEFMKEKYQAPKLLIGHSLGGAAVLMAAHAMEYVKGVVTIGAPADPGHVEHQFLSSKEEIEEKGEARVLLAGRPFTIKKQFIDDLDSQNMVDCIKTLKRALLVMHSPIDTIVGVDNARQIYVNAIHPKSYISLDTADHLLTQKEDSVYAGQMIATWALRYIDLPEKEKHRTEYEVVSVTEEGSYTTEILAGNHTIIADEPLDVGGNDFGPNPYNLLSAALGACTGMTLRMYANHKGWDLKDVKVHLTHEKRHVEDSEKNQKLDHIDRAIELEGDLTDDQRQRLLEIANRCPVHRTLHSEVIVNSKLVLGEKKVES